METLLRRDSGIAPRPRYKTALVCLLALVALAPLVDALGGGLSRVLSLYGAFVAVLAVAAASDDFRHRGLAILLAVLCLGLNAPAAANVAHVPIAATGIATLVFLGYSTWRLLSAIGRTRVVSGDVLAGALAAYLMVGLTWSMAWGLVEVLAPASIRFPAPHPGPSFSELLYFSFATLMTIGYGDITPVSPGARTMAVFEGLMGLAFTTVLLAFLVAKYLARREDRSADPPRSV